MDAHQPRVLIVDNDVAILRLLSKWLEASIYDVRCCEDGEQAVAAIQQWTPHIVVTDWNMPRMDGLQLCQWLRLQTLPHYVYIIFLTGRGNTQDVVSGLGAGADEFITKPVAKEELLARLRTGFRIHTLERRLSRQARCDSLTDLATRRTLYDQLVHLWRSYDWSRPLSCVMVDIDFFKRINDTHGHSVGDEVIRRVAHQLKEHAEPAHLVARYGGEEFCAVLPGFGERQAEAWADEVRKGIDGLRIPVVDGSIHITASLGVAARTEATRTPEELIDLADQSLLVAKQSGRDTVVSFRLINESARLRAIAAGGPGGLFKGLQAHHVMRVIVASLSQDETVGRAVDFFLHFRISSAPVIDDGGRLVGYLSERDVMNIMLWPDCRSSIIKDVMKTDVIYYEEDTPVLAIYDFLCRVSSIRSVLIVKNGRPTGMLSRGSIIRWFHNCLGASEPPGQPRGSAKSDDLFHGRAEKTARKLVAEARKLEEDLCRDSEELLPCLVGGTSRMQELLNDLLAYSRDLNASNNRAFEAWLPEGKPAALALPDGAPEATAGIAPFLQRSDRLDAETSSGG